MRDLKEYCPVMTFDIIYQLLLKLFTAQYLLTRVFPHSREYIYL